MSTEQITAEIEKALTEQVPSKVSAEIRKRLSRLDTVEERLKAKVKALTKTSEALERETEKNELIESVLQREKDIERRESFMTELEIRKQCAEQRVIDHQTMVQQIFRNPITRTQTLTNSTPGEKQTTTEEV